MEDLNMGSIAIAALVILIAGIVIGSSVITLDKMGDTVTQCYNDSFTFDATNNVCTNSTPTSSAEGKDNLNLSNEYYAIYKGIESQGDISEQMPTLAIIIVMTIIIGIIAAVFVYTRYM